MLFTATPSRSLAEDDMDGALEDDQAVRQKEEHLGVVHPDEDEQL